MQLFKYRVPSDDAEIFDACTRRPALRAENYSQGILLSGLPLYLDKPGRAFNWTPLASVLSWKRSRTGLKRFLTPLPAADTLLLTATCHSGRSEAAKQPRKLSGRGQAFNLGLPIDSMNSDDLRCFALRNATR